MEAHNILTGSRNITLLKGRAVLRYTKYIKLRGSR